MHGNLIFPIGNTQLSRKSQSFLEHLTENLGKIIKNDIRIAIIPLTIIQIGFPQPNITKGRVINPHIILMTPLIIPIIQDIIPNNDT